MNKIKFTYLRKTYSSQIAYANNYISWILSSFSPHINGKIIEIGMGHASYFRYLKKYGEYLGLDIDKNLIKNARFQYPEGDFIYCDVTTKKFKDICNAYQPNTIISINVLEHIKDDFSAIQNLAQGLGTGGKILLFVPAFMPLYNDLDRLAGHYRRYNKKMIRNLISQLDVKIIKLEYFNPIGGLAWWLNRLISHSSLDSKKVNQQIIFFEKYILQASKKLGLLTKGFFGQSLIVVLEKI